MSRSPGGFRRVTDTSPLGITIRSYDQTAAAYCEKTLAIDTGKQITTFNEQLPSSALILDVGCGPGRDAKHFTDLGHQVIGIDLSEQLLNIARIQAPNADFYRMDVRRLPFSNALFDGVWAMSVLQHLEKRELSKTLEECARVLKPNGSFYFCLKRGTGESLESDTRYGGAQKYYAYYTNEEVLNLLTQLPFTVLKDESIIVDVAYATAPWMDFYLRKT